MRLHVITVHYSKMTIPKIYYSLSVIYEAVKSDKLNLFQMCFNTKTINNDPHFIQNNKQLIDKNIYTPDGHEDPRMIPFIHMACDCNAFKIILYLFSLKSITLSQGEISYFISRMILPYQPPDIDDIEAFIESIKLVIYHPNFNHQLFCLVHRQSLLQYTLTQLEYNRKFDQLWEDIIQVMISFGNSLKSKQEKIDFFNGISGNHLTCLDLACMYQNEKTINILLKNEYIAINVKDEHNNTPLMTLCKYGSRPSKSKINDATLEMIFDKSDGNVFETNDENETCLIIALKHDNKRLVKVIGEYLNKQCQKSSKHKEQIKMFVKQGDAKSIAAAHDMSALYNQLFAHLE